MLQIEYPKKGEYAQYMIPYLEMVGDADPLLILLDTLLPFYQSIPVNKINYRYAPDKWTVAESIGHVIDTERIFSYRLFRLLRQDPTALAGFDQDDYIGPGDFNNRSWTDLLDEYTTVRENTLAIIHQGTAEQARFIGTASGAPISARAMIYMICGHELHHFEILQERYL